MIPVILSGGSGTRLWPVSRAKYPKQFANLFDESLLSKTVRRLSPLGSPWTITTKNLQVLTDRLYREFKINSDQILYEPFGKNTAPAIAVLCWKLMKLGRANEVVGIFPADHFVEKEVEYLRALKLAETVAKEGAVVTIGIHPTFPATGYGYIETSSRIRGTQGPFQAVQAVGFREKPSENVAAEFLRSGNFYWNAGMFVFQVSKMAELLAEHAPKVWGPIQNLKPDLSNWDEVYRQVEGISIDYAVMEKLKDHVCIPCDIGWNDVGSWDEVAKLKSSESQVIEVGGAGNYALGADEKLFAFVGVSDIGIVETSDAVLVVKRGESQRVKDVVENLKSRKTSDSNRLLEDRNFEIRPWGRFEILRDTAGFKSKIIHVEPGHQLSYQSHAKRAEHWVIVKGSPEVVLNDVVHKLKPGESIFIPQGAKHRMRNPGSEVVEFIEVQVGTYFGEDDIVRYQDDYKRS